VAVRGPGLITQFNGNGIIVSGNTSSVEGIAMTSICAPAIFVSGGSNQIEGNSISRALVSPFLAGGEITLVGKGNRILHNEVGATGGSSDGILVFSPGNLIEANNFSGNPDAGINIVQTGNVVRHNQALGNLSGDIIDNNAAGANTYANNLCQTAVGGASCQLPNIAGHSNFEPNQD
jgi:Right handed beta helix region